MRGSGDGVIDLWSSCLLALWEEVQWWTWEIGVGNQKGGLGDAGPKNGLGGVAEVVVVAVAGDPGRGSRELAGPKGLLFASCQRMA